MTSRGGSRGGLPPASGASPRHHNPHPPPPRSARNSTEGSMMAEGDDMSQELKMLNWYKLANEAAMKAALVKHKRFKDVPKYNPAAERVRQRATWLEQVIAEEQNKPLELESQAYKELIQKEAREAERQRQRTFQRHEKIVKLKTELKDKEERKLAYRKFLAMQEVQRKKEKTHTTTESIYGPAEEAPVEVGMSAEVLASLNSLEQLEERVSSILIDESAKAPGSIVLDLSNARDVGVSTVRNSSMDTLNAEQVTFIKRRTEPRLNQPSQVYYTAKVVPSTVQRREAVQARNTYFALDVPEKVMQQMQELENLRAMDTQKSRQALATRASTADAAKSRTMEDVKAMNRVERAQQMQAREMENQRQREEQDKVDEVIKEWLRGRNRRALKRDKKMRDIMRADRRFLSELQVSKDVKPTSNPLEATMGASGSGWTPNVGADYGTDEIDRKLDVLLQQQKQMEKWKPKKSGAP